MIDSEDNMNNNEGENKLNDKLSSDELSGQAILFLFAGYNTTSATLTHCINYLSLNKDIQQKLYEELKNVSDFSYESLSELKYLNAVISETLRLEPPLPRVGRHCSQILFSKIQV